MDYIDGIIDAPYDTAESRAEMSAYRQTALDFLYRLGCEYSIKAQDMRKLCELACINFDDLQRHKGVTA